MEASFKSSFYKQLAAIRTNGHYFLCCLLKLLTILKIPP